MSRKLIVILVFLAFLVLGGLIIFNYLGGNNPIQITLVNQKPTPLSGIYYVGTPQDPSLKETFEKIETEKSLHPGSFLQTIYEVEPAGKLDTMRVFVGIDQLLVGDEYEQLVFEENRYLLARIQGSRWVMPGPEKVKSRLQDFADSAKLELSEIFIDKIISENEVHVIAPIRN
ncbi:hypothetical protein E4S40_12045 [Algoriphagus kandeliae]|uniref:GyrI-like small molecule binding domain-containing protein n=1 Tax=Algoriphagus kandeliae TaxID=2562278 RepID=A0A4Y9QQ16_9BACT|nr:hypothetical protein [Algoriphagus kandeliae]TFV94734.1 hypothetical protein E4S40_12045 [Algoriphagus kandeliae]